MKSFLKKHVPFLIMSSLLIVMIVFLIIISTLKNNQNFAEQWTRTFGIAYTSAFAIFNENFAFSLTEVSIVVTIISLVIFLAWAACCFGNRQIWGGIHKLMLVTLVIVGGITMYNASVGMAYNRKALPLEKYKGEIKVEEFKDIAKYYVDDLNYCASKLEFDDKHEIIPPYSRETLIYKLRDEFKRLPNDDGYFGKIVPKAKALYTSGMFTSFSIAGMYFGLLGESNYNSFSTNAELPFYIMHELAHGVGVMREDDAQLIATYLCLTSDDYYLRYSCYYVNLDSVLNLLRFTDHPKEDREEMNKLIDKKVWENYNYIYYHWKGKAFMSDFEDRLNDWYLKTFGQKDGTASYDDSKPETDPSGKVISLSRYQNIYVKYYYDQKNS